MRTAFFGGSFNPPHVAHQMVCLQVLQTADVDRVMWVPVGQHPFAKDLAPFDDRFEMCRRAAAPFGAAALVSRVESELPTPSRTLATLRHLVARAPDQRLALVIGTDLLPERDKWYGWDVIERLCDVIVVGRAGYPAPGVQVELPALSSTDIRARLRSGEDVSRMVPATVLAYIREHGLYGAGGAADGG
ncbi:MAG: nicotinate (nicotinamide) nucleotide adenylyltransferase [Deltaproteobacteria bacterium]|nr:nicotinate (nicotinamide) nucleotide adenylyltransferase [Deltaproteobacteria bacterium]